MIYFAAGFALTAAYHALLGAWFKSRKTLELAAELAIVALILAVWDGFAYGW